MKDTSNTIRPRLTVEFADEADARRFVQYVEMAHAQTGTVTGVYAGLMCSALSRATVKKPRARRGHIENAPA